ncbi:MAG TPA: AMP-binding protein, partial [Thermoplasmata archaeon]|nr:AMP-binding protein [Thermoplasmata archaeon]
DRLRGLGARLLITADGGFRRGRALPLKAIADAAVDHAPSVETVVVVRRSGAPVPMRRGRDVAWDDVPTGAAPAGLPTAFPSNHPLFLLYSSGTTGEPKAIVHGTGGYLAWVRATLRWVFDPRPDDVFWCAADIGWVTGHSYIVFGPLANGLTSVLYEGALDHPAPDRMWAIAERYRVNVLYTSPTALRAQRRRGDANVRAHDLSALRLLGSVGETINPAVFEWYARVVGGGRCPVVDTWWQTETGGILVSATAGLGLVPERPGSATFALPGIDVDVVRDDGTPSAPGEKGFAVVRRPWPGLALTLLADDDRFRRTYWTKFPGAYYPGDFAFKDADGYLWFLGRADEVLKVAGHRLGTIELEHVLLTHPTVAEAAVCGVPDLEKGEVPVAFVVLREAHGRVEPRGSDLAEHVAVEIGPFARPSAVHLVRSLPKTRSGKIMRRVVRAVAEGRADIGDVTTLEDEGSVDEIRAALEAFRRELERSPP